MLDIVLKTIEAVMPTNASKVIALVGVLLIFFTPEGYAWLSDLLEFSALDERAFVAKSRAGIVFLCLLGCFISVARSNFRLVGLRNDNAARIESLGKENAALKIELARAKKDLAGCLEKETRARATPWVVSLPCDLEGE